FDPFDPVSPRDENGRPRWPEGFPKNDIENVRLGKRPPGNALEFDWGPLDKPDLEVGDGRATAWAVNFLQEEREEPFFLAAGIYRPHLPWYVPQSYFDLYPLNEIRLPPVKEGDLDDLPPA